MPFPIKVCVICKEEFELKPDKPGFANRCPTCSDPAADAAASAGPAARRKMTAEERRSAAEVNEARRQSMRNLLYRKDS